MVIYHGIFHGTRNITNDEMGIFYQQSSWIVWKEKLEETFGFKSFPED